LFQPGYSMPSVIANEFGESSELWRAALIALGVLLFIFTIVVNLSARALVNRSIRRTRGA
jgi:phosphate transport system permease protein